MKMSAEDLRIIRAALRGCIEEDGSWDDLSDDALDRAADLLHEIIERVGDGDDEDEDEDEEDED